jgi:hypothetical protein
VRYNIEISSSYLANASRYTENALESILISNVNDLQNHIFQQDNAHSDTTAITREFLKRNLTTISVSFSRPIAYGTCMGYHKIMLKLATYNILPNNLIELHCLAQESCNKTPNYILITRFPASLNMLSNVRVYGSGSIVCLNSQ